jgi:hypothetical protein
MHENDKGSHSSLNFNVCSCWCKRIFSLSSGGESSLQAYLDLSCDCRNGRARGIGIEEGGGGGRIPAPSLANVHAMAVLSQAAFGAETVYDLLHA